MYQPTDKWINIFMQIPAWYSVESWEFGTDSVVFAFYSPRVALIGDG